MSSEEQVVSLQTKDEIETEASAWVVQLHGHKPTDKDLCALREWMERSPYHRKALIRLAELWKSADSMPYLIDRLISEEKNKKFSLRRRAGPSFVAMACIALLGMAVSFSYFYFQSGDIADGYYTTEVGVQRTVNLQDGSVIRMNTDSAIEVNYSQNLRSVKLARGEALFEVEKDSSRPFVVSAGESRIEAVGTAFAIRMNSKQVELTVSEGIVEFSKIESLRDGGPATRIEAFQKASISPESAEIVSLDNEQLERSLAWQNGTLVFKGESLEYVIDEITRYTKTEFVFDDPSLRSISIGGHFETGEIEGLIIALEESFGIKVIKQAPNRVILTSG